VELKACPSFRAAVEVVEERISRQGDQGLTKVLEKLTKLLSIKAKSTSAVGALMPGVEVVQKIELMSNDIKLEGVKNYLS
jgi:hypothetical protein